MAVVERRSRLSDAPPREIPASGARAPPLHTRSTSIQLLLVDESSARKPPEEWFNTLKQNRERARSQVFSRSREQLFAPPPEAEPLPRQSRTSSSASLSAQQSPPPPTRLVLPAPFMASRPSPASMPRIECSGSGWLVDEFNKTRLRHRLRSYSKQLADDRRLLERDASETAEELSTIARVTPMVMRNLRVCGNRQNSYQVRQYALDRMCLCRLRIHLMRQASDALEVVNKRVRAFVAAEDIADCDVSLFTDPPSIFQRNPGVASNHELLVALNTKVSSTQSKSINIAQLTWNMHYSGFTSPDMFENWVMGMQHKPSLNSRSRELKALAEGIHRAMEDARRKKVKRRTQPGANADGRVAPDTEREELEQVNTLLRQGSSVHSESITAHLVNKHAQAMRTPEVVNSTTMALWSQYAKGLDPSTGICTYRWRTDFGTLQNRFDEFIEDRRFPAGQAVHRLKQVLRDQTPAGLPADQVVEFIEICTNNMLRDHNLGDEHHADVMGLLQGFVYPRVLLRYLQHHLPANQERDKSFRDNCKWLRTHPPSHFAIEPQFTAFHTAAHPPLFWEASEKLEEMEFLLVPGDLLLCVYDATIRIYNDVLQFANVDPSEIGADQLMPLLVFATVHANLVFPNTCIQVVKMFSTDQDVALGELGYYLACWEGAVAYITDLTREEFASAFRREQSSS